MSGDIPDHGRKQGPFPIPAKVEIETFKAGLRESDEKRCGQACLAGGGEEICRATRLMADKILFVEARPGISCRHRVAFGYSTICTCPMRKVLFLLHGI
jgi:hypothetical protein